MTQTFESLKELLYKSKLENRKEILELTEKLGKEIENAEDVKNGNNVTNRNKNE